MEHEINLIYKLARQLLILLLINAIGDLLIYLVVKFLFFRSTR